MTNAGKIRLALLFLLALGIGLSVYYRDQLDVAALQQWVAQAGPAGPLLFMAAYAIGTVLFLPGSVLTLAGGALFGPLLGTFYNLTGATLGALLAFLVSRYLAADWVAQRTGGRLKQLKEGVEKEGWRFVAFTRLVPLFPFNLLNYALGLTRIRFWHYLLATWICMLPGAFAYTWLGYAGREAVTGGEGLIRKALFGLALLAMVAFLPRLISRLREGRVMNIDQLRERLEQGDDLLLLDVRSAEDYTGKQSHIKESLNIPLETLTTRLGELAAYHERPITLICTTDRRSAKAARILAREGFGDVHVVSGGMTQWHRQALPVYAKQAKGA